jgi:EAL domain-containing protein (putative c-di-GMP-specific phosphodiesterase class I)
LSYLRRFPVDILKIAKDFVASPDGDSNEWAFAAAIIALGRALDLRIVAEGIEEPGQLERLRALGCEFGQGFLFARPGPIDGIANLIGLDGSRLSPPAPALPLAAAAGRVRRPNPSVASA